MNASLSHDCVVVVVVVVVVVAVCFETYGCQMNVNDTEIAWSILQKKGYQRTTDINEVQSDIFLCSTSSSSSFLF